MVAEQTLELRLLKKTYTKVAATANEIFRIKKAENHSVGRRKPPVDSQEADYAPRSTHYF
jgi:hypothetical protein